MKVAVLILTVAIVGAFAQDTTTASGPPPFVCTSSNSFVCTFQKLGHQIKYHATKLGGKLKDVGSSILGAALDQGKNLLATGGKAVLGTVLEHLNKEGVVGKREVTFLGKVKEHLSAGFDKLKKFKEGLHAAFKKAVNKLTGGIIDTAALKGVDDEADKKIDDAVAEYEKEGKKGFFGMAKTIAGKFRDIFQAGMDKLRERFGKKKMDERAILGFNSLSEAWAKAKTHLSGLAGSIADTFRPHLDSLKSGIKNLADKAKEHGGKLLEAAKGHFNTLKTKLSGHIDVLKGHAAKLGAHALNAVSALKEAVSSIAMQAVGNAKDTLGDIVKTGTDAAGVVSGHVADAISGN